MKNIHTLLLSAILIATSCHGAPSRFAQSLYDMETSMMHMMEELDSIFTAPLQSRNDASSELNIQETTDAVLLQVSPLEMEANAVKAERNDDTLEISVKEPHLNLEIKLTENRVHHRLEEEQVHQKENEEGVVVSKQAFSNTQSFMQSLPAEVSIKDVTIEYNEGKRALKISLPKLQKKSANTSIPVSIKN